MKKLKAKVKGEVKLDVKEKIKVKVTHKICCPKHFLLKIKFATRVVNTFVFPEPAPARTKSFFDSEVTASL